MLDEFSLSQKIAYNIIKKSIINDKCSHAYLINTNGYNKGFDFVKAISKTMLCPYRYFNNDSCINCNQCKLIDDNSFPELKIIECDGIWIKKEQTDILMEEFSKKSVNSQKKIYIINDVDKLNVSASNSILKFLEEPEDNIVALLITDNIYNVLNTILSRCQIINLNNLVCLSDNMLYNIANVLYNSDEKINEFVSDEKNVDLVKKIIDFIIYLENNKLETLVFINKLWNEWFTTKDDYLFGFEIILMFYNDLMNYKLNKKTILNEYNHVFDNFINLSLNDISKRIDLVLDIKNDLYFNLNLNLLMDKYIIKMEEL